MGGIPPKKKLSTSLMLLLNFRHTKSNLLILAGGQLQTPIAIQFIDMITNNS